MDGENEKGKREGVRGKREEKGEGLMRTCACEQVSAKREAEAGGGEEKSQGKSMREQASVNSLCIVLFCNFHYRVLLSCHFDWNSWYSHTAWNFLYLSSLGIRHQPRRQDPLC